MENDLRFKHSDWYCGYKFMKWGIGFFIFGFLVGFGVLIHYLVGSRYDNSESFVFNMTLWFGSPLSLSASYLQIGGLGMAVIGGAKLWLAKMCSEGTAKTTANTQTNHYHHHGHGLGSLTLSVAGLIALFVTGYIGYFVIDSIWPGFYYTPIQAGKNLWLVLQGLSLLCYVIGIIGAFCCICKCRYCKSCCDVHHKS